MRTSNAIEAERAVTGCALHVFYLTSHLNHSKTIWSWTPFQGDPAVLHVVLEAELSVPKILIRSEKFLKDMFWYNHLAGRVRTSGNRALCSFVQLAGTVIFKTFSTQDMSAVFNSRPEIRLQWVVLIAAVACFRGTDCSVRIKFEDT